MKSFFTLISLFFLPTSLGAIDNSVPIYYQSELPAIKILVGGEEKLVLIDTGAASLILSLKKKILQKDGIDTKEIQRFKNIEGKEFSYPIWMLKEFSVANIKFKNTKVQEYVPYGLDIRDENVSPKPKIQFDGSIGLKFFEGKRVIFDFEKNKMHFVDSFPKDINSKNWIHFSDTFEFYIQLDRVRFKSVLDTGTNISFILKSSIPSSFSILLCDFFNIPNNDPWYYIQPKDQQTIFKPINEPWRLFIRQFQEPKVHIIIGMDTLKGKRLFLDYIDKKYFIC